MSELLDELEIYWSGRTEGYSEVNKKELQGIQRSAWLKVFEEQFEKVAGKIADGEKKSLRILDIGTGPGFFPRILAEAGYHVTAVDYTTEMLEKAKENAEEYADKIVFRQMDAQNLEFENESFDVIISRNLTWNLEKPEQAYREWYRVLSYGGMILNFDANWYGYLFDEEKRKAYEQDRRNVEAEALDDHYLCTDIDKMEQLALQMPLSPEKRPEWDESVLSNTGFKKVYSDIQVWKRVWSAEEKLNYGSTPMFMVMAEK